MNSPRVLWNVGIAELEVCGLRASGAGDRGHKHKQVIQGRSGMALQIAGGTEKG